jgi:hypothetical protein
MRWEDAAVPLPRGPEELEREREARDDLEAADSRAQSWPEWEVRVELVSHSDVGPFAERLRAQGLHVLRRWRFLLVGADTEDQARALADMISREAPNGTLVIPQGSGDLAWRAAHPSPFVYLQSLV